jgi:hypothetical protein
MLNFRCPLAILLVGLLAFVAPPHTYAYSILTHEQLIDLLWSSDILPMLHTRFPDARPEDLRLARKYAYGGALLADAGYYPKGEPYTANLTHYVLAGDFVTNLFRNATDVYELAFAVGALTHYVGDTIGHSTATNPSVAIAFPNLVKPGGTQIGTDGLPEAIVTYEDGEAQYKQVEVGFDINSLNHKRFIPKKIMDRIGFDVPLQQFTYAFYQTYGLQVDFTHTDSSLNLHAYAGDAKGVITEGIYAIASKHKKDGPDESSIAELPEFQAMIANAEAEGHWNKYKRAGGFESKAMIVVLGVDPAIPIARVEMPITTTQRMYIRSVLQSVKLLKQILKTPVAPTERFIPLWPSDQSNSSPTSLPNFNLDTGHLEPSRAYRLTDDAYFDLLGRIVANPTWPIPPSTKTAIQTYFSDSDTGPKYDFVSTAEDRQTLAARLQALITIPTTEGCPDFKFGTTDIGWVDPNPEHRKPSYVPIPALCDSASLHQ